MFLVLCLIMPCIVHSLRIPLKRRLFSDSIPVHRESDGVWWADICISDQCFSAIIDTSSSTIAVPCQGCDCGNHRHFDPTKSNTATTARNLYSQCYGEGSCNYGVLWEDSICFGDKCTPETSVRHSFGCCSQYSNNFKRQHADGIIGMSPSGRTLWKDMVVHHKLDLNQVSICFGTSLGHITVGGFDNTVPNKKNQTAVSNIQWTDVIHSNHYYNILVSDIVVGLPKFGQSTHYDQNFMIDSGSSFSYLHQDKWTVLRDQFDNQRSNMLERNPIGTLPEDAQTSLGCYKINSEKETAAFPDIVYQIQQTNESRYIEMHFAPDQYFFLSNIAEKIYCVGIFKDSMNVIGANLLENHMFVFRENHIGIAAADCERKLFVSEGSYKDCISGWLFAMVGFLTGLCIMIVGKRCIYKQKEYSSLPKLVVEEFSEEEFSEEDSGIAMISS